MNNDLSVKDMGMNVQPIYSPDNGYTCDYPNAQQDAGQVCAWQDSGSAPMKNGNDQVGSSVTVSVPGRGSKPKDYQYNIRENYLERIDLKTGRRHILTWDGATYGAASKLARVGENIYLLLEDRNQKVLAKIRHAEDGSVVDLKHLFGDPVDDMVLENDVASVNRTLKTKEGYTRVNMPLERFFKANEYQAGYTSVYDSTNAGSSFDSTAINSAKKSQFCPDGYKQVNGTMAVVGRVDLNRDGTPDTIQTHVCSDGFKSLEAYTAIINGKRSRSVWARWQADSFDFFEPGIRFYTLNRQKSFTMPRGRRPSNDISTQPIEGFRVFVNTRDFSLLGIRPLVQGSFLYDIDQL